MTELKPCSFNFKPIKEFGIKAERKPRKQIELDIYRFNEMQIFRESGMTYEEIGKKFNLSRQRVHQILKGNKVCKVNKYFIQDITFCSKRDCENKKCERNSCHINWTIKPYHSFADFEGTEYCIKGGTNNDRYIKLPCKVGQTVYYISFGKVYKGKCHAITQHKDSLQIHLYDYDGDNASISADRVFLTKEKAERALKEREKV